MADFDDDFEDGFIGASWSVIDGNWQENSGELQGNGSGANRQQGHIALPQYRHATNWEFGFSYDWTNNQDGDGHRFALLLDTDDAYPQYNIAFREIGGEIHAGVTYTGPGGGLNDQTPLDGTFTYYDFTPASLGLDNNSVVDAKLTRDGADIALFLNDTEITGFSLNDADSTATPALGAYSGHLTSNGADYNDVYFTLINSAPTAAITLVPTSATIDQSITADATASFDPDPSDMLTFAWDLDADGDFNDSTEEVLAFTPADFGLAKGDNEITVQVSDGTDTSTASATLTVLNSTPIAIADSGSTALATPLVLDVLTNDSDPDGDTLSVAVANQPGSGTATVNADGSITYQPDFPFIGEDIFSYTVTDEDGAFDAATVSVTVGAELNLVIGSDRNDRMTGTQNDDLMFGLAKNDRVEGGAGNDIIFGGNKNDRLFGGEDDDILVGGPGNDNLDGGSGLDVAIVSGAFADFRVQNRGARVQVQDRGGSEGNDTLSLTELVQFDDGFFDTRNGEFTEDAFATPEVEALVTNPGFTTDPVAPPSPTSAGSVAQVEMLVTESETVA